MKIQKYCIHIILFFSETPVNKHRFIKPNFEPLLFFTAANFPKMSKFMKNIGIPEVIGIDRNMTACYMYAKRQFKIKCLL